MYALLFLPSFRHNGINSDHWVRIRRYPRNKKTSNMYEIPPLRYEWMVVWRWNWVRRLTSRKHGVIRRFVTYPCITYHRRTPAIISSSEVLRLTAENGSVKKYSAGWGRMTQVMLYRLRKAAKMGQSDGVPALSSNLTNLTNLTAQFPTKLTHLQLIQYPFPSSLPLSSSTSFVVVRRLLR